MIILEVLSSPSPNVPIGNYTFDLDQLTLGSTDWVDLAYFFELKIEGSGCLLHTIPNGQGDTTHVTWRGAHYRQTITILPGDEFEVCDLHLKLIACSASAKNTEDEEFSKALEQRQSEIPDFLEKVEDLIRD